MPKRPSESPSMPHRQRPRDITSHPTSPHNSYSIDPDGEEAYQNAALKAAEMKPPRVPNPLAYPNSPTAQAFLKARTQEVPDRQPTRVPNPVFVAAPLDVHARERKRLQEIRKERQEFGTIAPGPSSTLAPVPASGPSSSTTPAVKPELASSTRSWDQIQGQMLPPFQHPPQQQHPQHNQQPRASGQPARIQNLLEPQVQAPTGPRNPFR